MTLHWHSYQNFSVGSSCLGLQLGFTPCRNHNSGREWIQGVSVSGRASF
jgi:hypothetical protein